MKPRTIRRFVSAVVLLSAMGANVPFSSSPAIADIYRWDNRELITTLDAEPFADFRNMELNFANFGSADLTSANFAGADLTRASFAYATLASAVLADATVSNAFLYGTTSLGFTAEQLYSTANYQNGYLDGIDLRMNDLTGWDFAGKNLTDVNFSQATLASADFSGAVVANVSFWNTTSRGLTAEQFYSTASYQNDDLNGVSLGDNDLSGWDFAGMNLTGTNFSDATLVDTDFTGAVVTDALFRWAKGFTLDQLRSTASYQNGELHGIGLNAIDLTGCSFAGKDLTHALFERAILAGTDFRGAIVTGADFSHTMRNGFSADQFYSTASYMTGELNGVRLSDNDLGGWDFAGKSLVYANFGWTTLTNADFSGADATGAAFYYTNLTDTNFSGAVVASANFRKATRFGFTAEQLYSTASYQNGDLGAINLRENDLSGWDFAGMNLAGANFADSILVATDFSGANLTGANLNKATLPRHLPMLPVIRWDNSARVRIDDALFTTNAIIIESGGQLAIAPSEFSLSCDVVFQLNSLKGAGLITAHGDLVLHPSSTLEVTATGASPFAAGAYRLLEASGIYRTFGSFTGLGEYATEDDLIYTDTTLTLHIDTDLLPADANLDIQTDLSDFNIWNANKFTSDTGWTTGDFNGDGVTDLSDFNIWNAHKFAAATGGAAPAPVEVPEPGTLGLLILAMAIGLACQRWRRGSA